MSWLFLINDFIAVRKLGQKQDCFPYWQDSWIRFCRHLLAGIAQYVSKLGHSVRTATLQPATAACACWEGKDDQCIMKIKQLNERKGLLSSKVTKEPACDDESVLACGSRTCCSVLWWISGCHCRSPTGKHNYNSLISSILSVALCPREAKRWSGFITCLLPQVIAPAHAPPSSLSYLPQNQGQRLLEFISHSLADCIFDYNKVWRVNDIFACYGMKAGFYSRYVYVRCLSNLQNQRQEQRKRQVSVVLKQDQMKNLEADL